MFDGVANCLWVSFVLGGGRLRRVYNFLLALSTYYPRVVSRGHQNNLYEVLRKHTPGARFFYCVSRNPSTGLYSLAYLEPEDLWLGIPVSSKATERRDLYGNLEVCPVKAYGVHSLFSSVVQVSDEQFQEGSKND